MVTSRLDTREKILDAALVVAANTGFNRATTKQIAKNACVSEGIIYHYFKSKNELYLEIIRDHAERMRAMVTVVVGQHVSARDKLCNLIEFHIDYFVKEKNIFQVIFGRSWENTEMMDYLFKVAIDPYVRLIEGIIRSGISNKEFKDVVPEVAATSLNGMMQLNIMRLHFAGASCSAQELKDTVKQIFFQGIERRDA